MARPGRGVAVGPPWLSSFPRPAGPHECAEGRRVIAASLSSAALGIAAVRPAWPLFPLGHLLQLALAGYCGLSVG